ncbi:MAG: putative sucrose:Na+ symporter [Bacteroidetes bacterium HLUCCA01]|nr:MAG: putative sucrose:Na+ symporter [Bacteroidetes bacterium HLUCCA01]
MFDVTISLIDYIIIGIYFAFIIWLGLYFKNRHKSEEDYFLAGRSLAWPVIGFSLFASNMGSISLIGLAESGYRTGFAVFSYEWMATIVLIIFAVFFLPYYLKNRVYTIPEFLERRYGTFARYYFSGVTITLNIFIDIASGLFAGALVVKMAFPDLSLTTIIWAISLFAAFYTLLGGLASVVYSDTVQAVLLIFSSIVVTVLAFNLTGGWDAIVAAVGTEHLTIIRPASDPDLPWPGLFSGVFLLGFYFWVTNQFIAQRALAAKDTRQGQWGALFAGLLKLSALFIMVLPGVMAIVLFPDLDDPKNAYPTLIFNLLPAGLLGLTLAGFIAALMSSVDSGLNAASTLFTFDFYKKYNPDATKEQTMKIAKIMIGIFMVIAALWAPQINKFPSFWDYLQMVLSFICPPIVALFIFGLFSKRINTRGANASIITGVTLSVLSMGYKFYVNYAGIEDVLPHYLYLAGIIFIVCSAVLLTFSLTSSPDENKDWESLIWTPAYFKGETASLVSLPFYKNYRYQSIGLLILVATLLIIF